MFINPHHIFISVTDLQKFVTEQTSDILLKPDLPDDIKERLQRPVTMADNIKTLLTSKLRISSITFQNTSTNFCYKNVYLYLYLFF